jgi:hypothetical protein
MQSPVRVQVKGGSREMRGSSIMAEYHCTQQADRKVQFRTSSRGSALLNWLPDIGNNRQAEFADLIEE